MNAHPDIYFINREVRTFVKEPSQIKIPEVQVKKKNLGEKCPEYCTKKEYLARIHDNNPQTKLILLIRKPIQRA